MSFSFTNAVFQSNNSQNGSGGGNVKDTDFFNGLSWDSVANKAGLDGMLSKDTLIESNGKNLTFKINNDFSFKLNASLGNELFEFSGLSGMLVTFGHFTTKIRNRVNGGFSINHPSPNPIDFLIRNNEASFNIYSDGFFSVYSINNSFRLDNSKIEFIAPDAKLQMTSKNNLLSSQKAELVLNTATQMTDPGSNVIKLFTFNDATFMEETTDRLALSAPFGVFDILNAKYHKSALTPSGLSYSVFNVIDSGVWNEITTLNENGIKMTDNIGLLGVNEWLLGDTITVIGSKTPSNTLLRVRINGTVYNILTFETE